MAVECWTYVINHCLSTPNHFTYNQPMLELQNQPMLELHNQPMLESHNQPMLELHNQPMLELHNQPMLELHNQPMLELITNAGILIWAKTRLGVKVHTFFSKISIAKFGYTNPAANLAFRSPITVAPKIPTKFC